MEIIRAKHMGFCFGVSGAIETCHNVIKEEENKNKRIFILGMLVHNQYVVDKLKDEGFLIVEEEEILKQKDDLTENDIVIVRAHGTLKKIYNILSEKRVKVYDSPMNIISYPCFSISIKVSLICVTNLQVASYTCLLYTSPSPRD